MHTVSSEDAAKRLSEAVQVMVEAKRKWRLAEGVRVAVIYEAGHSLTIAAPQGWIRASASKAIGEYRHRDVWMWLRYQSTSALARWFAQRTADSASSERDKRIAIVAVAPRLTIASGGICRMARSPRVLR